MCTGGTCLLVDVLRIEHSLPASEAAESAELLVGGELDEGPPGPPSITEQMFHGGRCSSADACDPAERQAALSSVPTLPLVSEARIPPPSKISAVSLVRVVQPVIVVPASAIVVILTSDGSLHQRRRNRSGLIE